MAFKRNIPASKAASDSSTQKTTFDPIFLNIKDGNRTIRFLGDEVLYREHWMYVTVGDKKMDKPIIVGKYDWDQEKFLGAGGDPYYVNPLDEYLNSLDDAGKEAYKQEQVKRGKEYPQLWSTMKFMVNVYDRTLVIKLDGKVHYPNSKNEYDVEGTPEPHNTIMVLNSSSGKPGGEHLHQKVKDLAELVKDPNTGKVLGLDETDFMLVTKEGKKKKPGDKDNEEATKTRRSFMPLYRTDVIEYPALYDLEAFVKPWPYDAIQALMDGGDYMELRKEYDIPMFPSKVEDIPF